MAHPLEGHYVRGERRSKNFYRDISTLEGRAVDVTISAGCARVWVLWMRLDEECDVPERWNGRAHGDSRSGGEEIHNGPLARFETF
jgi:hypothetical protein